MVGVSGPAACFASPCAVAARSRGASPRVCGAPRARWTCMTDAHPYGNGGLNNVVDLTGYDRERERAALRQLQEDFDRTRDELDREVRSKWVLIFNTDIIQWHNNLVQAVADGALHVQLDGPKMMPVMETVARRLLDPVAEDLWVLRADKDAARSGADEPRMLSLNNPEFGKLLLAFEREDDATRFAVNLKADDRGDVTPKCLPINEIKSICEQSKFSIGFIPPSFIQPSHFNGSV